MTYARLCEHGEVKAHVLLIEGTSWISGRCPGGSVLPDDTVERAWWCKANRALRTAPGICNREIALHPQCRWVTIIQEPQWSQVPEQRPTETQITRPGAMND